MNSLFYIASCSRSGSTLLDNLLSNHPDAESVGELRQLSSHLRHETAGRTWNWRCTCGLSLTDCPVWTATAKTFEHKTGVPLSGVDTVTGRAHRTALNRPLTCATILLSHRLRRRFMPHAYATRELEDVGKRAYQIIEAYRAETNARIIIDSSKTPEHLYALIAARPQNYQLKVIHLIRDGRAVLYSAMNRAFENRDHFSLWRATGAWCNTNLQIAGLRGLIERSDWLTVRYEDLCAHPQDTVRNICNAFQLPFNSKMLGLSHEGKHNIGGSPHRFNWAESTGIRLDTRWRSGLQLSHKLFYYGVAGGVHAWLARAS